MTTGEKIYEARKKAGMTQEELADKLGVSRQAVSKWESDSAYPETDKIVELCKLFSLSSDELLLGAEHTERSFENARGEKERRWDFDNKDGHLHFEYVSKARIGKLPLVHINIGLGAYRAKGVIAVGNLATGIISLGFLSVGILSAGLLAIGLFAFGTLAFGLLAGAGAVATGLVAFGGVAIGILCFGGVAVGYIGIGGCAVGRYAVGGFAKGFVAVGLTQAKGTNTFLMPAEFQELCDFLTENVGGTIASLIKGVASSLGK